MSPHTQLFEFLCVLTDVQIKKYASLAAFGVGPDARLNAQLVFSEVRELLTFSDQLLVEMETNSEDQSTFITMFNQVRFYMEQEHIRSYAGWLLAENNIHATVYTRVLEQLTELNDMASSSNLDISTPAKPITEVQRQCEHDSAAIAFRILNLAIKIKADQEMPQAEIPDHAFKILQKNATTRYVKYSEEIAELHKKYDDFLHESDLEKNSTLLQSKEAKKYEAQHTLQWSDLFERYKKINANSKLFSSEHEWYKIGVNDSQKNTGSSELSIKKPASLYSNRNLALFSGGVAASGLLLVYMLMRYFSENTDENSLQSTMNFH